MRLFVAVLFVLLSRCNSRSVFDSEEDSVVSVYTTQPTTAGTSGPLDVYQQIANNIAERLTSPIYRFLGIGKNKTEETTTKQPLKIELLDEAPEEVTKPGIKPVSNDISNDRDVEELSVEALKRIDKKPEKITLYSSYLPAIGKLEANDTSDEENDIFEFDDVEQKPREGGFVYVLEFLGSIIQLAWGAFLALFKPSNQSS